MGEGGRGRGDSHMKMSGILMVSLRCIKSKILVSIRVFLKKHHYFSLSKYLLGCTRRDI